MWRYLSWYEVNEGGKIEHYGKGYGEESVTLPAELQQPLAAITTGKQVKRLPNETNLFVGTSYGYPKDTVYKQIYKNNQVRERWYEDMRNGEANHTPAYQPAELDFVHQVHFYGDQLEGNFFPSRGQLRIPPENLKFAVEFDYRARDRDTYRDQRPNFDNVLGSWKQRTSLYGSICVEAISSRNDRLIYLFCSDREGRVWIGHVETT